MQSDRVFDLPTIYENTSTGAAKHARVGSDVAGASLTATPVLVAGDSVFGAEVAGVDWSRPISEDVVKELIDLQDRYAVLIFRRTGLDNARHVAFSQQLGNKLEINPFFFGIENDRLKEPFLFDVANIELDGSLVKIDSRRWQHSLGNALWHTVRPSFGWQLVDKRLIAQQDSSYHQQRSKYSILLSHGAEEAGGYWTHFADTRRAYADLPEAKKKELEDLVVEHDLWHSRRLASPASHTNPTARELALKPPAHHKLVQVAPDGRKTLYLAAHAKRIVGRSFEESQELIWELIHHCTQSKYVFSMEWTWGGDMVWWDNRQSMHRANPYTEGMSARDVRRSTIIDDGPLAFGVPPGAEDAAASPSA